MVDQELLQAISQIMDEKLNTVRKDIMHDVTVLMDADFGPRFEALGEQIDLILDKLPNPEDAEIMDTRVSALEAVVKKHSREINELKKAN